MFGIDSSELAIIALVALLVIGPKDLPRLMRVVGQWMAKARGMTRHVRAGFDTMMREAELEEMKKQWAAQNEAIMKASALPDLGIKDALPDLSADSWMSPKHGVSAEMRGLHSAGDDNPAGCEAVTGNEAPAPEAPAAGTTKPQRRRKAVAAGTPASAPSAEASAKPARKRPARAKPPTPATALPTAAEPQPSEG